MDRERRRCATTASLQGTRSAAANRKSAAERDSAAKSDSDAAPNDADANAAGAEANRVVANSECGAASACWNSATAKAGVRATASGSGAEANANPPSTATDYDAAERDSAGTSHTGAESGAASGYTRKSGESTDCANPRAASTAISNRAAARESCSTSGQAGRPRDATDCARSRAAGSTFSDGASAARTIAGDTGISSADRAGKITLVPSCGDAAGENADSANW